MHVVEYCPEAKVARLTRWELGASECCQLIRPFRHLSFARFYHEHSSGHFFDMQHRASYKHGTERMCESQQTLQRKEEDREPGRKEGLLSAPYLCLTYACSYDAINHSPLLDRCDRLGIWHIVRRISNSTALTQALSIWSTLYDSPTHCRRSLSRTWQQLPCVSAV